ncbi:MAG: hypothetical protein ACQER4_04000 [Bacteroidota bacterium]
MNDLPLEDSFRANRQQRSGSAFSTTGRSLYEISALRREDIDEIVAMSQDLFPGSRDVSPDSIGKAVCDLYFHPTQSDTAIPSLVSRSACGVVDGFLGVRTSRFSYNGRTVVAANCHHLMATGPARSRLVPMKILQQFLRGSQDFSFADGSVDATRHLWKRLGGEISMADSLYYKIPLRPLSFAARVYLKSVQQPFRGIIHTLSSGMDGIGNRLALPLFRRNRPEIRMETLSTERLLEGLDKANRTYTLFPNYDPQKIDYLLSLLEQEQRFGRFHRIVLLDDQNDLYGWFLYYANKGGVCEVIQAVSLPGKESILHDALTWHAFDQGGIELSGRLMSSQLKSPLATRAVCMPGRMWTLIHSRDCELKNCILSGRAFLTRLEGDLWLL